MSESSTEALAWLWDNDPDLLAIAGTPIGDATLIVQAAAPARWGKHLLGGSDMDRAAVAVSRDPHYRDQVFTDARYRVDHAPGAYGLLGKQLMAARERLSGSPS